MGSLSLSHLGSPKNFPEVDKDCYGPRQKVQFGSTLRCYSCGFSETAGGSDSRRKPGSFRVIFLFSKAWYRWSSLTSTLNARKLKDSLGNSPYGGKLDKQPLYARKQVWSAALCIGTLLTFYVPTGIIWGKLCAEENNSHLFLLGIGEYTSPAELFGSFFTAKKKFYTPHCPFKDSGYWNAKAQIQLHAESQHFQPVEFGQRQIGWTHLSALRI